MNRLASFSRRNVFGNIFRITGIYNCFDTIFTHIRTRRRNIRDKSKQFNNA
jgi:hypothetical protein